MYFTQIFVESPVDEWDSNLTQIFCAFPTAEELEWTCLPHGAVELIATSDVGAHQIEVQDAI